MSVSRNERSLTAVVTDRGRITLPARARRRLGIEPGDELVVVVRETSLELIPLEQVAGDSLWLLTRRVRAGIEDAEDDLDADRVAAIRSARSVRRAVDGLQSLSMPNDIPADGDTTPGDRLDHQTAGFGRVRDRQSDPHTPIRGGLRPSPSKRATPLRSYSQATARFAAPPGSTVRTGPVTSRISRIEIWIQRPGDRAIRGFGGDPDRCVRVHGSRTLECKSGPETMIDPRAAPAFAGTGSYIVTGTYIVASSPSVPASIISVAGFSAEAESSSRCADMFMRAF